MNAGSSWVMTLPLRSPMMTQNMQRRAHWSQVYLAKKDTETLVWAAAKLARMPKFREPVVVQLAWYPPDNRSRDTDGLAPMMKAVLDAMVKIEVLEDDNSKVVTHTVCGPIEVDKNNPRFEVIVYPSSTVNF